MALPVPSVQLPDLESAPDETLIKIFLDSKKTDNYSFEALIERHRRNIEGAIRQVTGNPELVELSFQSVLIHLFRFIETFNGQAKFSSWLYRMTANCALMEFRKSNSRSRQVVAPNPDPDGYLDTPLTVIDLQDNRTPEKIISARQQLKKIIKEIKKTNKPVDLKLLISNRADCIPPSELARRTGFTAPKIKSKIYRITTQIRKIRERLDMPRILPEAIDNYYKKKVIKIMPETTPPAQLAPKLKDLKEAEKIMIAEALTQTAGNKSAAAKLLGLKRSTLLAKINRLGIYDPAHSLMGDKTNEDTQDVSEYLKPARTILRIEIQKLKKQIEKLEELERHYEAMDYSRELETQGQENKSIEIKLDEIKKGYPIKLF